MRDVEKIVYFLQSNLCSGIKYDKIEEKCRGRMNMLTCPNCGRLTKEQIYIYNTEL